MTTWPVVAPTRDLNVDTIPIVLDALVRSKAAAQPGDTMRLDLTRVRFVTPAALVQLAAILTADVSWAAIDLDPPLDEECRRYLTWVGFFSAVAARVRVVGDTPVAQPGPLKLDTVLPLTRLQPGELMKRDTERVEGQLRDVLHSGDATWRQGRQAIVSTVRELCVNVYQHAGVTLGGVPGWISVQRWQNRRDGSSFVEIALSDAGRGVRASLSTTYPDFNTASDGTVLERVLREELSSRALPGTSGGGTGFNVLKRSAATLNGSFWLRSGTATIHLQRRRTQIPNAVSGEHWPGTHLVVRLSCS
ncbi:MAG TPA: ATP-binding protein [Gemmatimonadaceae bacterium]